MNYLGHLYVIMIFRCHDSNFHISIKQFDFKRLRSSLILDLVTKFEHWTQNCDFFNQSQPNTKIYILINHWSIELYNSLLILAIHSLTWVLQLYCQKHWNGIIILLVKNTITFTVQQISMIFSKLFEIINWKFL